MKTNRQSSVVGARCYIDGELVAENVNFRLPEITFQNAEVVALGNVSIPIHQLPENLECAITFIGVDSGLRKALRSGKVSLEFRWAVAEVAVDNSVSNVGKKFFADGIVSTIPAISPSIGEAGDNEVAFTCFRVELFSDGERCYCIDKMAGKVVIGDDEPTATLESLL